MIGTQKLAYDLWGDTVNTASRMQSLCPTGCVQVTAPTHALLSNKYSFERRGSLQVKGKGEMETYFLLGRKEQECSTA